MIEIVKLGNGTLAIYRPDALAVLVVKPDERDALADALKAVE